MIYLPALHESPDAVVPAIGGMEIGVHGPAKIEPPTAPVSQSAGTTRMLFTDTSNAPTVLGNASRALKEGGFPDLPEALNDVLAGA